MTSGEQSLTSGDFPVQWPVLTRWTDNDMFGHLNNAVYYELFDTAINAWINTDCGIDPLAVPWLGVVAGASSRSARKQQCDLPAWRL
jgi:acyl-CoA thioester hydrolase